MRLHVSQRSSGFACIGIKVSRFVAFKVAKRELALECGFHFSSLLHLLFYIERAFDLENCRVGVEGGGQGAGTDVRLHLNCEISGLFAVIGLLIVRSQMYREWLRWRKGSLQRSAACT